MSVTCFWNGFARGYARSTTFGALTVASALANRYGYNSWLNPAYSYSYMYDTSYIATCFTDLDSPSGLTSWVDGGYAINRPYYGGYTGNGYGIGGWGVALGTLGSVDLGYGGICINVGGIGGFGCWC